MNKLSTSTGGYIDRRIKPHSDTWRQRNPPEAVIRYDTPALSQRRISLPVRNSPGPREQQMAPRKPKRVAQVGVLGAQSSHLASCRQDARQTSTAINMIRQPDASLPCARMRPQRIPFFHGLRYIAHRTCGARLRWTNGHGSLRACDAILQPTPSQRRKAERPRGGLFASPRCSPTDGFFLPAAARRLRKAGCPRFRSPSRQRPSQRPGSDSWGPRSIEQAQYDRGRVRSCGRLTQPDRRSDEHRTR